MTLRPYDKALDYGFIISTWPKAIYYGSKPGIDQSQELLSESHNRWFKAKFEEINAKLGIWNVRMAIDPEDPSFILGYSITGLREDARMVCFVYIKKGYRCQGIGTLLCGPEKKHNYNYADWTDLGKEIIELRNKRGADAESQGS